MTWLEWFLPWEPSMPIALATVTVAWCYIRGNKKCQVSLVRQTLFWVGLLSLYLSAQSKLDYYSEHAFFIRQIQDSFLHHTGPFLIAASLPGRVLLSALPDSVIARLRNLSPDAVLWHAIDAFNNPFFAVALFCGVTALWLVPRLQLVAMLDPHWNALMDWSMVVNGLMFWGLVLNAHALRPAHLSAGCRIAMMLVAIPPQIAIGALLFFASHPLYQVYSLCGLIFPGVGPLADQQIGGLILWVHGAMMSVIGILVVARREWLAGPRPVAVNA